MTNGIASHELDYWMERLAEPWLLQRAVLLDVRANETPLAVPVGVRRRGGHIEGIHPQDAKKAVALLQNAPGFPNPRIEGTPGYLELRWGDPVPFGGCDYYSPFCGAMLGIYYGYKYQEVARLFEDWQQHPVLTKKLSHRAILQFLRYTSGLLGSKRRNKPFQSQNG
jgi:hypothetical protein